MIKKRYALPALVLGAAVLGGSSVYAAYGPQAFNAEAFSSFSAAERTAIEKAFTIRQEAHEKAEAVLTDAGITRAEMRTAMQALHRKDRAAIEAALDANDYAAFTAAIEGKPMAEDMTQAIFAKLVQIRKLEKAGDKEGARELREDLRESGVVGMGMMGGGRGGHGPRGN